MPICDGCGVQVSDQHIRERIERLELATRFRPVHIQVLLIDAAPPQRLADYFYNPAKDHSLRSPASRMYFDELVKCIGVEPGGEIQEELALADFQRRGLFVTYAAECPMDDNAHLRDAIQHLAPTVLRRVQMSYRPKYVALLSLLSRGLLPAFQTAGWGDRLVLDGGVPFAEPFFHDPPGQGEPETRTGDRLAKALASLV